MKAFVDKQFRKSNENLKDDDEFFIERKHLNSLHNYFSHSLLYLERLDSAIKNINIMISDLNTCLMSFFENDVNLEIIKHVSYILNSFNNVREKITSQITQSKTMVNNTLNKIKNVQNLCIKKRHLSSSIEHYEKKIKKLQAVTTSNQKHLDKVIRNEHKLNKVKTDYLEYHENIKKGFDSILENKTSKVLFDARKDLEILLCYFSLMNSVSLKLKDPLNELKLKYFDRKTTNKLPIEYNFFLEEEDNMNIFTEKKKNNNNPFSYDIDNSENNAYKSLESSNLQISSNDKKNNNIFKIKSFLKVTDKSSKIKTLPSNLPPIFPQ
ncbi:conserved Plasmodium protein, unknown function [Plasmodium relictum]|uniref:Uncharacterized protein n=1 Tax=Plasmodium relictum TaxID=85471 RepID=A0A1J1H7D0_PLARL|nr:conserved Plasmodium protein, unknown function [Plasmodium relictum]CRH00700.1 conserved Plasmodium protein, unknown function [Plasmodium relictum]